MLDTKEQSRQGRILLWGSRIRGVLREMELTQGQALEIDHRYERVIVPTRGALKVPNPLALGQAPSRLPPGLAPDNGAVDVKLNGQAGLAA